MMKEREREKMRERRLSFSPEAGGALEGAVRDPLFRDPFLFLRSLTPFASLPPSLLPQVIISDGQNFAQGMLATQLNHFVQNGQLIDNSIVEIRDFMSNVIQGKTVVILLAVNVITVNHGMKIGSPTDVSTAGGVAPGAGMGVKPPAQSMYGSGGAAAAAAAAGADADQYVQSRRGGQERERLRKGTGRGGRGRRRFQPLRRRRGRRLRGGPFLLGGCGQIDGGDVVRSGHHSHSTAQPLHEPMDHKGTRYV